MNIAVLTGAGMSAESGLKTFRDSNGLWEGHDVMQVATPQGFKNNPELVLDFYNQRRRQLLEVAPNDAHHAFVALEKNHNVTIITQNVDDLHERAGSSQVIHLHGELLKVRSIVNSYDIQEWRKDLVLGDTCKNGHQLRPHIVWFGEDVPLLETAIPIVTQADVVFIVGTSMQVYPAAGLVSYAKPTAKIFYIDKNPAPLSNAQVKVIAEPATTGVPKAIEMMSEN